MASLFVTVTVTYSWSDSVTIEWGQVQDLIEKNSLKLKVLDTSWPHLSQYWASKFRKSPQIAEISMLLRVKLWLVNMDLPKFIFFVFFRNWNGNSTGTVWLDSKVPIRDQLRVSHWMYRYIIGQEKNVVSKQLSFDFYLSALA